MMRAMVTPTTSSVPGADVEPVTSVPDELVSPPDEPPHNAGWTLRLLQRYWATTLLIGIILVAGIVTGAMWRGIEEGSELFDAVAYGLPAFEDGKWLTAITGAFFAPHLALYIPILALMVVATSTYERRVGHWQTLLVVLGGQALAVLVTAGFLKPFEDTGWTWAVELGRASATSASRPAAMRWSPRSPP